MNPCYNSIALARHQHDLDRQEAKENFIAAEVDRLLCDNLWCIKISEQFDKDAEATVFFNDYIRIKAKQQANAKAPDSNVCTATNIYWKTVFGIVREQNAS